MLQPSTAVSEMECGEQRDSLSADPVQQNYNCSAQTDPSTSTAAEGPESEASRGSETESSCSQPSPSDCLQRFKQQRQPGQAASLRRPEDSVDSEWGGEESGVPGGLLRTPSPPPKRKRLSHAVILQACRGPGPMEYSKVGISRTYSDLDISGQQTVKHAEEFASEAPLARELSEPLPVPLPSRPQRKNKVLHNVAMMLTFVAVVSLWGIVDVGVEVASGVNSGHQFQLYAMLLLIGVLAALALRRLKALSYRWTSYPTLLASLLTAAAAWGLVDVAIEAAAGEDRGRRLLYYFLGFLVTGFLVALHVALVDRGFSKVVEGFI